jgi:hypothetical protein
MGEETRAAVRAVETLERKDRVLIVEDEDCCNDGAATFLAWEGRKRRWRNSPVTSRTR